MKTTEAFASVVLVTALSGNFVSSKMKTVFYQPGHRSNETHPFPEYRRGASYVSCLVQQKQDKKDQVAGYDRET